MTPAKTLSRHPDRALSLSVIPTERRNLDSMRRARPKSGVEILPLRRPMGGSVRNDRKGRGTAARQIMTFPDACRRPAFRRRGCAAASARPSEAGDLGNYAHLTVVCAQPPERKWRISADSAPEKRLKCKKTPYIDRSVYSLMSGCEWAEEEDTGTNHDTS